MNGAAWSAIGVMVAAFLVFLGKLGDRFFDWLTTRKDNAPKLDAGVSAAADVVVSRMTGNYEWIAGQLAVVQAEVTELRTSVTELRTELTAVTNDRDGLVLKLDASNARIDVLEQMLRDNGLEVPPPGAHRPPAYRSEILRRAAERRGQPQGDDT